MFCSVLPSGTYGRTDAPGTQSAETSRLVHPKLICVKIPGLPSPLQWHVRFDGWVRADGRTGGRGDGETKTLLGCRVHSLGDTHRLEISEPWHWQVCQL